jgi:hypothetical protein
MTLLDCETCQRQVPRNSLKEHREWYHRGRSFRLVDDSNRTLSPELRMCWYPKREMLGRWLQLASLIERDPNGSRYFYASQGDLHHHTFSSTDPLRLTLVSIPRPSMVGLRSELVRFEFYDSPEGFSNLRIQLDDNCWIGGRIVSTTDTLCQHLGVDLWPVEGRCEGQDLKLETDLTLQIELLRPSCGANEAIKCFGLHPETITLASMFE